MHKPLTAGLPIFAPLLAYSVSEFARYAADVRNRELTDALDHERHRRFAAEQRIDELREKLDAFANDAIDRLAPSDDALAEILFRKYSGGEDIKTLDVIDVANWVATARKAKEVLR